MKKIPSSEITPESFYQSRRRFLKQAIYVTAGAGLLAACGIRLPTGTVTPTPTNTLTPEPTGTASQAADELGNPLTPNSWITSYNNFYEFTTDKGKVAERASRFVTSPWTVQVGGLVRKPQTLDLDDIRKQFSQEERIYRMRCVETWAMVIPWMGFPLHKLLTLVEPLPEAKYVHFETLYDPAQMPEQKTNWMKWPYSEGLRLDEAMHDLTLLATGIYGSDLRPQNGAPIRLVVPWKYGFKSIKSIVKIELTAEMPMNTWNALQPAEYGFYANVNPDVPHPRWLQATERFIGREGEFYTRRFNGYENQVASLYTGMNLKENF